MLTTAVPAGAPRGGSVKVPKVSRSTGCQFNPEVSLPGAAPPLAMPTTVASLLSVIATSAADKEPADVMRNRNINDAELVPSLENARDFRGWTIFPPQEDV